jgi:transcriptional regulator with XRE-family HTH domain
LTGYKFFCDTPLWNDEVTVSKSVSNEERAGKLWEVVEQRRTELGLSKRALSIAIGQEGTYVYNGLRRKSIPGWPVIRALSKVLSVPESELMGGDTTDQKEYIIELIRAAEGEDLDRIQRVLQAVLGQE